MQQRQITRNMKKKLLLFIIFSIIILCGYLIFSKKTLAPVETQTSQSNEAESDFQNNFQYDEVISKKIGSGGGVLENADKSIIATFPPLEQEIEVKLSFKKSEFKARSGARSPVTINIYPDITFNFINPDASISIKAKYDSRYALPVPYYINEKKELRPIQLKELDAENNYFIMDTFRGGDFSWVTVKRVD